MCAYGRRADSKEFASSELREIERIVVEHRELLVRSWHEYFGSSLQDAIARAIVVGEDTLTVDLADGRSVSAPIAWFPRLAHGTAQERNHWRLIGNGEGIHWPDLDEDIRVASLLEGKRSGETQESLRRWLTQRSR